MENWGWSAGKSADQLARLHELCTPDPQERGARRARGSPRRAASATVRCPSCRTATLQACRDVFQAEIPHYFRHLFTDEQSVAPRVEYASGLDGPDPQCVVSIIGCTGDWFGGWDGLTPGSVDQFITADLKGGRLPEVIARGEPADLVCHWPGIYFNGQETGFKIFQEVVRRLHDAYDHLIWMKLSEIARYWAARELTRIERPAPGQARHSSALCLPPVHTEGRAGRRHRLVAHRAESRTRIRAERATVVAARFGQLKSGTFFRQDGGCCGVLRFAQRAIAARAVIDRNGFKRSIDGLRAGSNQGDSAVHPERLTSRSRRRSGESLGVGLRRAAVATGVTWPQ